MNEWLSFGLTALVLLAAAALFLGIPIWAAYTTPAWDLQMIRSEYQGLQGLAGPYLTVSAIQRDGVVWGFGKYEQTKRIYVVTLTRENGEQFDRRITITASVFGPGSRADA